MNPDGDSVSGLMAGALCLGSVIGWWLPVVVSGFTRLGKAPLAVLAVVLSAGEVAWLAGPMAVPALLAAMVLGGVARLAWLRSRNAPSSMFNANSQQ